MDHLKFDKDEDDDISEFSDDGTPIYEKSHQPKTTKDVVQIIGNGIPEDKSAKLVPSQPKGNASFMIDTSYLQHWKDVLSDDLGVWEANGTKTAFFTRSVHADGLRMQQTTKLIIVFAYLARYPAQNFQSNVDKSSFS